MNTEIKIKQAIQIVKQAITTNTKILLVGKPGEGKTDIVKQAAEAAGFDLEILHPATSDPTDIKGMPVVQADGSPEFKPFGDMKRLIEAKVPTVAFLDDLGQAPVSVQGALMQLLHGGELNGEKISEHVVFIAATNDSSHMAGVSGLLEPVKSRFSSIIHVASDSESWCAWAAENEMPPELIQFIRFAPDQLNGFKPTRDLTNTPNPRTVASFGKLINNGMNHPAILAGAVGQEFTMMYQAFAQLADELPDIAEILANPDTVDMPSRPDLIFITVAALTKAATVDNFDAILTYLERLARKELRVFAVLDITRAKPELRDSATYRDWILENKKVLLGK